MQTGTFPCILVTCAPTQAKKQSGIGECQRAALFPQRSCGAKTQLHTAGHWLNHYSGLGTVSPQEANLTADQSPTHPHVHIVPACRNVPQCTLLSRRWRQPCRSTNFSCLRLSIRLYLQIACSSSTSYLPNPTTATGLIGSYSHLWAYSNSKDVISRRRANWTEGNYLCNPN